MTVHGIDLGLTYARIAWNSGQPAPAEHGSATPVDRTLTLRADVSLGADGDPRVGGPDESRPHHLAAVRDLLVRRGHGPGGGGAAGAGTGPFGTAPTPEAVVGVVLTELAERARAAGSEPVRDVVLATPGDFDVAATAALRRAADAVGLAVRGMPYASIAICLHYGAIGYGVDRNIVVCDVGATRLELTTLAVRGFSVELARTAVIRVPGDRPAGRVGELVASAVRAASAHAGEIDDVLLAGGGAVDPAPAREILEATGIEARCEEPDFAVAKGCVRYATFGFLRVRDSRGENGGGRPPGDGRARPGSSQAPPPDRATGRPALLPPAPETVGVEDPEPRSRRIEDPEPRARQPLAEPAFRPAAEPSSARPPLFETAPFETAPFDSAPPPPPPPPPARPPGSSPLPPRETPAPRPPAAPPSDSTAVSPPVETVASVAVAPAPVTGLQVIRRSHSAMLSWEWPPDSRVALVRWRLTAGAQTETGETRCARHSYENGGGFTLRVGASAAEFTVEALVPGAAPSAAPPSTAFLPAPPPVVRYDRVFAGRGRRRVARLTFAGESDCRLPDIAVVFSAGRYLPSGRHEGRVVHRVAGRPLTGNEPATEEFPFPAGDGPGWLVCFPEESPEPVELLPVSLHRLKVV